jgi:quinohemoprotein ethanol dehydrogenase
MTYMVGGKQYVAVLCGHGGENYFFEGTAALKYLNEGRILAFALDGASDVPKPAVRPSPTPYREPPLQTGSPESIIAGRNLFITHCARCHALGIPAISADLTRSSIVPNIDSLQAVLLKGVLQPLGMPRFSDVLSAGDVAALQSFLIDQSWAAYKTQEAGQRGQSH